MASLTINNTMKRGLITSLGNPLLADHFKSHTPRKSVGDMPL